MLKHAKTLTLVAFITALVWVLAEAQTLRVDQATVAVTVDRSADRLVRIVTPGWDGTVELRLEGSAARVDELLDGTRDSISLLVGREIPATSGTHTIDLRDAIRTNELVRDSGVSIVETEPAEIRVEVDASETRTAPVRVVLPEGGQIQGVPRAEPGQVTITGPRRYLEAMETGFEVTARVQETTLDKLLPGVAERVPVQIELPEALREAWAVETSPSQVDVEVTLRSRTRSITIPRLPVQVRLAPVELSRWQIEIAQEDLDLVEINLTGPSEAIDQIEQGTIRPVAVLVLSFDELERAIGSKDAQILGLPPGVQYEVEDLTVNLTVTRRGDTPEGGAPAGE